MSIDSTALSDEAQHVFELALRLPNIERAKLADQLALTVEPLANPEWVEAWEQEIARRVAEIDAGKAKLVYWEDLRRELWQSVDAARKSQAS